MICGAKTVLPSLIARSMIRFRLTGNIRGAFSSAKCGLRVC